jgi:glutathione S-transferase
LALTLVIGNKNYSSWSFRPWIAMKAAGIAFDEVVISLDAEDFKARVAKHSGSGKVPVLIDGNVEVWESLAILEYVAEKFPAAKLWPSDVAARAHARAISSEMHAGFAPLRNAAPMNMWRPVKQLALNAEVEANVARIDAMWTDCRSRFGVGGPFLFGAFTAADAMYAPVVSRFHTYGVSVSEGARSYMTAVMALPAWGEWLSADLPEIQQVENRSHQTRAHHQHDQHRAIKKSCAGLDGRFDDAVAFPMHDRLRYSALLCIHRSRRSGMIHGQAKLVNRAHHAPLNAPK